MSRAEEQALKAYPEKLSYDSMISVAMGNPTDENEPKRSIYIAGYEQAEKDIKADAIERTVKVDVGGYPYIDCNIELYDYDKDIPLAQKGEKVKVIIVKDND